MSDINLSSNNMHMQHSKNRLLGGRKLSGLDSRIGSAGDSGKHTLIDRGDDATFSNRRDTAELN